MTFNHQQIEKKWQDRWETEGIFHAKDHCDKPKFYCLIEFPYPSAAGLHIGHPRSYTALDVVSRKRRAQGYNVLYPIGWDAFGLPTENYAIKTGRTPQDITRENTNTFRRQLKSIGLSFDWSREINTSDPEYYKWTQWMFLEFFKAGLAYKTRQPINWCLSCKIGLANEEVVNGKCERCGGATHKRDKEQWMIAITKYADRLLEDLDTVDYLEKIKVQQRNWIGKSEGAEIIFSIPPLPKGNPPPARGGVRGGGSGGVAVSGGAGGVRVFTTRPDTIFGATFLVISPEKAKEWIEVGWDASPSVREYVAASLKREEMDRTAEGKDITGVDTGVMAINPVNGKEIPVWVADYVLGSYGTGAIMAVPAHDARDFEFAKKFGLPIVKVVVSIPPLPEGGLGGVGDGAGVLDTMMPPDVALSIAGQPSIDLVVDCFEGDGIAMNSGFLNGKPTAQAKQAIVEWLESKGVGARKITYKLRDWVFSRQRYWGEPIPLVQCEKCGWVAVPDEQLPVILPEVEKYEPTDTGESPLAAIDDWVNTTCPVCGGLARRETDTMPNWAGSSWYFLRYTDPHNDHAFASKEKLEYWLGCPPAPRSTKCVGGVDLYDGGMEHTTLHLLYSRFWNKFLFDRGHVPVSEPYARRYSHGLVLAHDGTKMSKSKGNVVNPDEIISDYGADALRLYILFMGPFEEPVPWNINGLVGVRRFLDKVVKYVEANAPRLPKEGSGEVAGVLERTLKKISDDIESFKFNTAVSAFMSLFNEIADQAITREQLKKILIVLGPFAPHLANECWEMIGEKELVEEQAWPMFDERLLARETVDIAVQVNGKARATITIAPDADETTARAAALVHASVTKHLAGKEIVKVVYVPGRIVNIVVK